MTQNKYNQLLNINLSIYLNLENKDIEHNKLIKIKIISILLDLSRNINTSIQSFEKQLSFNKYNYCDNYFNNNFY